MIHQPIDFAELIGSETDASSLYLGKQFLAERPKQGKRVGSQKSE
jgi:hypothetical protein